ncbi:MAG: family 20 glycosylhydrolase [Muribaculaceae bacterium]|nr:family 20 glycosylhydrolase [Muribaculaceae bacterium]
MRKITSILLLVIAFIATAKTTVVWENMGNDKDAKGNAYYVQRFTVKGDVAKIDRLCFNQFARQMTPLNSADSVVEIVPGYYYITSPQFGTAADSVVIDIRVKGTMAAICYAPDGVHVVTKEGLTAGVKYSRKSIIDRPEQWSVEGRDKMPYGDSIYRFNESLVSNDSIGVYDVIPSFKSVKMLGGHYKGNGEVISHAITHSNPEFYRITISTDSVVVEYASERALKIAHRVLSTHNYLPGDGTPLPCAVIEDYPDLPYRAVMIDIARNFQRVNDLQTVVQMLARYRLNTLHFHFCDDEAWRLEIPGLPELTNVGSRRGYTLDEKNHLVQIFAGNGDPNTAEGTANGYISRGEFIEFLRYCQEYGIDVVPEIESPGHARAAIKSMEARYRNTGDASYRLIEDGDTSRYTSAQAFHDNVMNPALPGPYKFMEKVIDEIALMYKEAGVPLTAIHIGGDEVPRGAWNGAPSALALIKNKNLKDEKGLHAYFVQQLAKILSQRGIKMNGWQEIAVGHTPEYNAEIAPLVGGVNCWSTLPSHGHGGVTREAVNAGYPIILSNVNHFYLDMTYNYHPLEKGLNWGGTVDEFNSLAGYPAQLCPTDSTTPGRIIGISGHVFAETMRSFPQLQSFLLPKMLGLAERAWNNSETYTPAMFNNIICKKELPRLALRGWNFHLRQPGIIVEDGIVKMNSPYPGAVIRYTLDGSEPNSKSATYTEPFASDATQIRARLYHLGKESVTTILFK